MAGRVDQIKCVVPVADCDRPRFDRDAALALEVHVVEHLVVHLASFDRARLLQQTIGERRLAVVDVGDDREVSDVLGVRHVTSLSFQLFFHNHNITPDAVELRMSLIDTDFAETDRPQEPAAGGILNENARD